MAPHPKSYYIVLLTRVRGFSALPKSEIFLHINTQIRPTNSANITLSYDLNMTQKLVRSVGGQMCTTHFKMDKTRSFTPSRSFFTPGRIYE